MAVLRIRRNDGGWDELPALVGRKGNTGEKGEKGDKGNNGSDGKNATINGVTALKIEGKNGIGATQNKDVLTLHLTGENNVAGAAAVLLNRSTRVNETDENYSTVMARGSSILPKSNIPDINEMVSGAIYWTYE